MKPQLHWQIATVKDIRVETPRAKSFTLVLPDWTPHRAGQHYDVRLTAPDGYQAQRSYSVASAPERDAEVELTVERIEGGEVSTYLHDVIVPEDRIEVRGPIGGYFVWQAGGPEPLLLIAGGSGVVPLMAMLRHRRAAGARNPARLLFSSRSFEEIIFYAELNQLQSSGDGLAVAHTLTRSHSEDWSGYSRRIDRQMLEEVAAPLGSAALIYICGPTALVESSSQLLVDMGFDPRNIRTERFGPSGG